jgi:copper resistance protein B
MTRAAALLAGLAGSIGAAPALAQDHSGHQGHGAPVQSPAMPDPQAVHAPAEVPVQQEAPAQPVDGMDHSEMGHGDAPSVSPGPTMETPPPPEAGSGPPRAADAIWGGEAMRASRRDLRHHGDFPLFWFQADRAEMQMRPGADGLLWDVQGYYGTPTRRFWFKSEGEGAVGDGIENAEVQALYSTAIAPFFDLQAGVRQDLTEPGTTHAVLGMQGLAPYMFEVDAALFLSHRGDLTARLELELDQRVTQALILQPRAEVSLSAQDIPHFGIGAGVDKVELGLRLRYEIKREFAPYIGIEQTWRIGGSADFARAAGQDTSTRSILVGIRFWL